MNRFPSRARGHASSRAYLRAKTSMFSDIVRTVRAFAAISYRFLAACVAFDRIRQPAPCIRWFRSHFEHLAAGKAFRMKIRVGFEMLYDFPQPTPMIMVLGTHFTRASDVIVPDFLTTDPVVGSRPIATCSATGAAAWLRRPAACALRPTAWFATAGCPIRCVASAVQHAVEDLPADTLVYLLGSRYCETDRLSDIAWQAVREDAAGLGAGPGDLRFRASSHRLRI